MGPRKLIIKPQVGYLSLPSPLEDLGSPQVGRRVPTEQGSIHGLTRQERETETTHDCNKLFYPQNTKDFSPNPSILRNFYGIGSLFRFYRAICFDKKPIPFFYPGRKMMLKVHSGCKRNEVFCSIR